MVGVSNPETANIMKLIIFQYSGKELRTISLVKPANNTIGNWEILNKVVNNIVSKFNTSSMDHKFSKVFSPYELNESKLKGIVVVRATKILIEKRKKEIFELLTEFIRKVVFVPFPFLLSISKGFFRKKVEKKVKTTSEIKSKIK